MKNKVLLLVPPVKKSETSEGELINVGVFPPLGLAYIASSLKKNHKINIKIIDALAENLSEEALLKKVSEFSPSIIGITVLTQQIEMALSFSKKVKCQKLCKFIVLGGPHVHFEHENLIKDSNVDVCVRGEGEITFSELVDALMEGTDLSQIKGITYKEKNGGCKINEDRPFMKNLEQIPFPDRGLLNNNLYKAPISLGGEKAFTSILATRGCPFKCHFCSLSKMWKSMQRRRSVENVLDEIGELYEKSKIVAFSFVDDLLVADKKWAMELCRGLCERGLNKKIIWDCCGRIKLMTPELLKEMKKAGCRCVIYGIEFGSQRMLDFINKRITIEDIHKTISMTNKVGIPIKGLFMMGYPTETKETLQDTLNLAKSLRMDFFTVSIVSPYPGTELYNYCVERNMLVEYNWIDIMQIRHSAIKLEHLTLEEVIEYINRLMRECMMQPSYMIHMILKHPKKAIIFGPKLLRKALENYLLLYSKNSKNKIFSK